MSDTIMAHNKKNPGGAPKGNKNATRHGLRASGLPKGCLYLQSQLTAFRSYFRHELEAKHGTTSMYEEAVLQSATRHETRALLASRWLRIEGEDLKIEHRITLTREIGNATDSRDRCLRLLGLDRGKVQNAIDVLYSDEPEPDDPADTADKADRTPPKGQQGEGR